MNCFSNERTTATLEHFDPLKVYSFLCEECISKRFNFKSNFSKESKIVKVKDLFIYNLLENWVEKTLEIPVAFKSAESFNLLLGGGLVYLKVEGQEESINERYTCSNSTLFLESILKLIEEMSQKVEENLFVQDFLIECLDGEVQFCYFKTPVLSFKKR